MRAWIAAVLLLSSGRPLAAQAAGVAGGSRAPVHPPHSASQTVRAPGEARSANVRVVAHLPMHGFLRGADIEIEQELARPYVYWNRRFQPSGLDIISLKDPSRPQVIWSWTIENPELHLESGSLAPAYGKTRAGRYYLFNGFEFGRGGPDVDLGAVVWDVTGLPDTATIREVARIRVPDAPGGFHETFAYKHSQGQALIFAVTRSPFAHVYDLDLVGAGRPDQGLVARIQVPGGRAAGSGWHDFFVGYDPAARQDRFYGAGEQGYHVFDVTTLAEPRLITSVVGVPGAERGHTFTVSPDGRYAYGMPAPHYQASVMRVFDLTAGQGQGRSVSRSIGAWTANWQNVPHNWEVRWPYIFAAAFEDGLQVINVMDPTNPYTVGFYDTWDGPHMAREPVNPSTGAWGVDVRNADGLIVVSDIATGFWAFKMNGFDGWNGADWGMPNVSSAQDWDNGPAGSPPRISAGARRAKVVGRRDAAAEPGTGSATREARAPAGDRAPRGPRSGGGTGA